MRSLATSYEKDSTEESIVFTVEVLSLVPIVALIIRIGNPAHVVGSFVVFKSVKVVPTKVVVSNGFVEDVCASSVDKVVECSVELSRTVVVVEVDPITFRITSGPRVPSADVSFVSFVRGITSKNRATPSL